MKNILLFLFLFSAKTLFAQDSILVKERIVTASKLNVRAEPNLKAKVIAQLPFGAKVEVLSLPNHDYAARIDLDNGFSSNWAKIKFQNKIGFVALAYLSQPIELGEYGVYPNIKFPYWYKIVSTPKGDLLKRIEVRADTIPSDFGEDEHYCIVEKGKRYFDENGLELLIASFQAFKEGKIGDYYSNCYIDEEKQERCPQPRDRSKFENDIRFQDYKIELHGDSLFFVNNKQRQFLSTKCIVHEYSLGWYGDFDMDSKPDFILETSGNRFFFLSSKAPKSDMVGLASHFTYCECD